MIKRLIAALRYHTLTARVTARRAKILRLERKKYRIEADLRELDSSMTKLQLHQRRAFSKYLMLKPWTPPKGKGDDVPF